MRPGTALRWAASRYRSRATRMLLLLLGWAAVWVILEILVVASRSAPGRPVWSLLHLGYFWGTAYWEAALLGAALDSLDEEGAGQRERRLDHRAVLSVLVLKLLLLPVFVIGTVLFVVPGVYCMARLGPAFFFAVRDRAGPLEALGLSDRASRGQRGPLVVLCLLLLLLNTLGAAFAGAGLVVTIPLSLLACAHAFREIGGR